MNDLLRFITCGSVDDGKSTLIGHMLYDAKLLFADQAQALILDSKVGSRGGEIDYSLLLDGLMAEREQGITIDVAYRYFSTSKRSFIVADTPGHEEYTRNMAVGASYAELAVILIDASQGVLTQTRRHTRICSLMGIRDFVFAVNKMDLIGFDEAVFKRIKKEIKILMAEFDYSSLEVIPVCATDGDNVTERSKRMSWYKGGSLLSYLEEIVIEKNIAETGFTMPIQRVSRPDHTFRGFQGQIETGSVKVGDEVTTLPSNETASVKRIIDAGRDVNEADTGHAVTIALDREVDISRGCVLVRNAKAMIGNMFTARLLWMDETPLVSGKSYILRLGTKSIAASVMKIKYGIDVNTGEEISCRELSKNEIAVVDIAVNEKIVFDEFSNNQGLGAFIFIDRVTDQTSGCGIVEHILRRSDNLTWHDTKVSRDDRALQKSQKPVTIWFTGLSGSGKSTLANELERRLFEAGKHTMLLDGDNVRLGLNKNLGFKEEDRIENIRRISEVAKLMNDAGLIVITAFVSPFALDRRRAKETVGEDSFIEVYVSTSIDECEKRDVKGLYKKAREGNLPNFTGISSPYEIPENPDIVIDTTGVTIADAADKLYDEIWRKLG